jgi:hypothetical protein
MPIRLDTARLPGVKCAHLCAERSALMEKTISSPKRMMHKIRFLVWLAAFSIMAAGCTSVPLYTINLRYEPAKAPPVAEEAVKKLALTVANFRDGRTIDDPVKIGHVLKPDGRKIYVLPEKVKAAEAVAAGVRDHFYRAGYSVSGMKPEWDLREETIDGRWGDIMIGGVINKLEVICDDSQPLSPVRTYSAVVNLGIIFADVAGKRIVYKTSAEGSASLKDVSFSIDKLENQLNGVLTDVIEKLFAGAEFQTQMKKTATR